MPHDTTHQPATPERANPKAEQAFLDYVALGPSRSLRKLHAHYRGQTGDKPPTKRFDTLADWSVRYHWQSRLADAVAKRTEALLEESLELDADTFVQTSRKLNESVADATDVQDVIRIREAVRKPLPRGGTAVNVAVNTDIQELAERVAREEGMDASDLLADAQQIAVTVWSGS